MLRKNLLIAIEGVDGVGKTTIARTITEKLNAIYVKTPTGFLKKFSSCVEKIGSRELEAIAYFISAFISSLYFRILRRKCSVVCDKYILVTVVDQIVLGSKVARFLEKFRYRIVPKPDLTFCLLINEEAELRKRIEQREKIDSNDSQMLPFWQEIQDKYQDYPEVIIIDTTHTSIDEIVTFVLACIDNHYTLT